MNSERDPTADAEDRRGRVLSLVLAGKSDREIAEARKTTSGPASAAPQFAPDTRRVLLADDHHINHLTIQAMLEDRGIDVIAAFDGAEALQKFKAGGFDRVLMDIEMPVMDGLTAVRAIRAFETQRGVQPTPIAMFTALSGRDIEKTAREAGADAYLTKPITLNQLYAFMGPVAASR